MYSINIVLKNTYSTCNYIRSAAVGYPLSVASTAY